MEQENESYNGWGNYQTWKVALNIDNDENLYNESREEIRRFRIRKGEDLKAWFCDIAKTENGVYRVFDEWNESELNEVDFDEIFTAFNSEIEEDERGED
jgi:hypothetical protein